jgi:hypothetical protein
MIKKALLGGLQEGVIAGESLYNLDDQGLFSLLAEKAHPLFHLGGDVQNGKLYTEALSFPFDEAEHGSLRDIHRRGLHEEQLAAEISRISGTTIRGDSVIIDVPEPVSFETGLFVRDENCYFGKSSSALKEGTVEAFVKSLRIVRIFTACPLETGKAGDLRTALLKNKEKWLQL